MNIKQFLILALAIFRIISLIHSENGPWRIFARLRFWLGVREGITADTGKEYVHGLPGFLFANLLACPWCIGFWISIVTFTAYIFYPQETLVACMPFALHGLAMYFYKATE